MKKRIITMESLHLRDFEDDLNKKYQDGYKIISSGKTVEPLCWWAIMELSAEISVNEISVRDFDPMQDGCG